MRRLQSSCDYRGRLFGNTFGVQTDVRPFLNFTFFLTDAYQRLPIINYLSQLLSPSCRHHIRVPSTLRHKLQNPIQSHSSHTSDVSRHRLDRSPSIEIQRTRSSRLREGLVVEDDGSVRLFPCIFFRLTFDPLSNSLYPKLSVISAHMLQTFT